MPVRPQSAQTDSGVINTPRATYLESLLFKAVGGSRDTARTALLGASLVLWLAVVLHCLYPLKDQVREWNDFAFVYAAGHAWLKLGSPYDVSFWQAQWATVYPSFAGAVPPISAPSQPYLYPPHWVLIAVPLAMLDWPVASRIWDACNVASAILIVRLCLKLLERSGKLDWRKPWLWICMAVCLGTGAPRWAIWECQLALLPMLGVVGAYWAWVERHHAWLVAYAFIALLKPQISVLALFCIAMEGAMTLVLIAGVLALGVGALAMMRVDWQLLPGQLHECIERHMAIGYNDYRNFYSVSALLSGLRSWSFISFLIGLGLTTCLALMRRFSRLADGRSPTSAIGQLSAVCAVTVAFVPLHGYDLVLLMPLAFWAFAQKPRWVAAALCGMTLVVVRSHHWGERVGIYPLAPWITLAIAATATTNLFIERGRRRRESSRNAVAGQ